MEVFRPAGLTALTTYLLSQVAKSAKRDLDRVLARRGFRLRHMAVLAALDDGGPTSQLLLGRRLGLDPSDVTATIDDLEQRRFVRRDVDATDRRRKLVSVTRAGSREFGRMTAEAQSSADALLAPLPARRRSQLHRDLAAMLERIDGGPDRSPPE